MEFKETSGQLERAMETLCAFLNGTGGTILFGATDKGKTIGQKVSDATKRNIAEKPALETELLEPIFPDQPSHPKQKYRLADEGKEFLK